MAISGRHFIAVLYLDGGRGGDSSTEGAVTDGGHGWVGCCWMLLCLLLALAGRVGTVGCWMAPRGARRYLQVRTICRHAVDT